MTTTRLLIVHPLLFGLFPVFFQLATNIQEVSPSDALLPALLITAAVVAVTGVLNLFTRNLRKSALLSTSVVTAFFLFGPLLSLLRMTGIRTEFVALYHNEIIMAVLVLIVLIAAVLVVRIKTDLRRTTTNMNRIGALLLVVQVVTLGINLANNQTVTEESTMAPIAAHGSRTKPDIIYFVTDAFARNDILKEIYGLDNSEFLDFLRNRGFYVADSSQSNYSQTMLSLASSLNGDYLDILQERYPDWKNRRPARILIAKNTVFRAVREAGYKIVTFTTGYWGTEFNQQDLQLSPKTYTTAFANHLVSMTPLPIILEKLTSPYLRHYEQLMFVMNKLPHIDEVKGPRMILAHIVSPHPPFLFDDTGGLKEQNHPFTLSDGSHFLHEGGTISEYIEGYRNQVKELTNLLTTTIDQILKSYGDHPPIIILQADHGPGAGLGWMELDQVYFKERLSILNALYLPDGNYDQLYPTITPVNTFRVILNEYFGGHYDLLPDRSFFSKWEYPYQFYDVTDTLANDNWIWDPVRQTHVLKIPAK